ncbi:hypothetical protein Glove_415g15 [Diversispora epigaea]|uniref:Uncharacterized protein n=1 Tax=Diversispora epigaea TaxID=1348612 RepID=A0A397GYL0_9GLOM|nr:hypothetical protein Glove_415g15 [Diversispora epigaea]
MQLSLLQRVYQVKAPEKNNHASIFIELLPSEAIRLANLLLSPNFGDSSQALRGSAGLVHHSARDTNVTPPKYEEKQ